MGIFKSLGFGKKEGGSAEVRAEAPKAEQKEKSSADTGRERLQAIQEGASSLWKRFRSGAKSVGDSLAGKARDAYSMALGVKDRAIDRAKGAAARGKEMPSKVHLLLLVVLKRVPQQRLKLENLLLNTPLNRSVKDARLKILRSMQLKMP